MSAEQTTERTCRNCGEALVRKLLNRSRGPELESPGNLLRRQYCDTGCWREDQRKRPPRPLCECGCGSPTNWRGRVRGWSKFAPGCYLAPRQNPRHPAWVDDGSGFWDWFAGFLDGEGFFGFIPRTFKRTYHTPVVRISVRLDDRAILDEIAVCIGGKVAVQAAYGTSRPQARWSIGSMSDCLRLIEILDAHPLRAKKARDYATWREAVLEKDREGNTERLDRLVVKLVEERRWNPDCMDEGGAA